MLSSAVTVQSCCSATEANAHVDATVTVAITATARVPPAARASTSRGVSDAVSPGSAAIVKIRPTSTAGPIPSMDNAMNTGVQGRTCASK